MKKIILLVLVGLLCACSTNTGDKQAETEKKNNYCSEEGESSCAIEESADMSSYEGFQDEEHQFIQVDMEEALSVFDNKESAILYFGYPDCPWCIEAVPLMNEAAKETQQHILYIRTRDENKELLYTKEQKQEVISKLSDYMEKNEDGEYELYVPFVVVVKDGKAISANIGTVDGHDAHERKMSEDEVSQLKKTYEDMFSALAS